MTPPRKRPWFLFYLCVVFQFSKSKQERFPARKASISAIFFSVVNFGFGIKNLLRIISQKCHRSFRYLGGGVQIRLRLPPQSDLRIA